jgi:hypothetical protein
MADLVSIHVLYTALDFVIDELAQSAGYAEDTKRRVRCCLDERFQPAHSSVPIILTVSADTYKLDVIFSLTFADMTVRADVRASTAACSSDNSCRAVAAPRRRRRQGASGQSRTSRRQRHTGCGAWLSAPEERAVRCVFSFHGCLMLFPASLLLHPRDQHRCALVQMICR